VAAPYFFSGDRGRYARVIFKAAVTARNAGKGLWSHCRHGRVPLRPTQAVSSGLPSAGPPRPGKASPGCNPHYRLACVPNSRADLDCSQIRHKVRIVGSDPYNLDSNGDGYGCESYA
jgi:hypothetical protein